jgi:AI-2 transport protein TqsA
MAAALADFASGTRKYLVVTTVFGLIVAVLDTVALWIIGVPLAVTWGLLSFITNYIPNIGFVLGLIPPALLGLLQGGWGMAAAVIVVYCLLNVIVQSVIQPRFVGDSVGLSVTVTFVALFFWAWLIGGIGAILAIPLTLLGKALLVDVDPGAGWADAFLRDRPVARSAVDADKRADDVGVGPGGNGEQPATAASPSTP